MAGTDLKETWRITCLLIGQVAAKVFAMGILSEIFRTDGDSVVSLRHSRDVFNARLVASMHDLSTVARLVVYLHSFQNQSRYCSF